jgi:transcriptional regulator with XRE-family HTH domain
MTENITENVNDVLIELGRKIRAQRKTLGVNATATAEAAGISRVTLHRLERGEPTVNMGAYASVMLALGFNLAIGTRVDETHAGFIPVRIHLDDYPQLKKLAWQIKADTDLTPTEALGIYERNWRHLDHLALSTSERQLIDALRLGLGKGVAPNV